MRKEQVFVIIGALWKDKTNGNTYHVTKIINATTGNVYYTPYTYGYDGQYRQSGAEYINKELKLKNFRMIDGGSFYINKKYLKKCWF